MEVNIGYKWNCLHLHITIVNFSLRQCGILYARRSKQPDYLINKTVHCSQCGFIYAKLHKLQHGKQQNSIDSICIYTICIRCVILCRPYHNYTKTTEYQLNLVNIVHVNYESQSYLYSLMKPKNFYELLFLPSTNSERTPRSCLFY